MPVSPVSRTPLEPSSVVPVKSVSRRRLFTALVGGGSLVLLGGLVLRDMATSLLPSLQVQKLGIKSSIFMAWNHNLTLVASAPVDDPGTILLWDYSQQRSLGTLPWPENTSIDQIMLEWSPDSQRLFQVISRSEPSNEINLICWNIQTRQPIYSITNKHVTGVEKLSWSPDGQHIAIAGSSSLVVLDASTGQEIFLQQFTNAALLSLEWASSGPLLALLSTQNSSHALDLTIWDTNRGQQLRNQIQAQVKYDSLDNQTALLWLPDGNQLVIAASQQLWIASANANVYTPLASFATYINNYLLAGSPDGNYLAVCDVSTLSLWDIKERRFIRTFFRGSFPSFIRAINWLDNTRIALIDGSYNRVILTR